MQIMISRRARGLREAKHLYHARVLIPTTSAGGHQLGKERRVVDVQFVGRDSHNVTVFGVHIADAEEVLAAAEEVMVELTPERHCCEARAGEFGKWVQSEAVGVEEEDIEDEGGRDGRQWPGGKQIEGRHGVADRVTARPRGLGSVLFAWTSNTGNQKKEANSRRKPAAYDDLRSSALIRSRPRL